MTRQIYDINHYTKNNFVESYTFFPLKNKRIEFKDKMGTYFSYHPIVFWAVAFLGIPIGILLAVGLTTTIFGLMLLWITSLM